MDEDIKKNVLSTGTSLVGIVCKDGVVMASDRRGSLGGQIVWEKNAQKTVKINDYLAISGTGTASDIRLTEKIIRAQLKLKELKDKARPTIKEAANLIALMLYQNIRKPSMIPFIAGLMVGGVNENEKTELYSITPDGSISPIEDYDANVSSGMPYILGLLERQYRKNMTIQEGINLALESIKSSSARDTASGNGIDVFTITKEGIKHVSAQKAESVYSEE